jgi:hypothetical protein
MATYRIVHQVDSGWHLYRDDELLDVDADPERADLDAVFRWAESVINYDDGVRVRAWLQISSAGEQQKYRAELV